LGAGNFGAGFFDGAVLAEIFVEGEADGLDGDVGGVGAFEEGSEWGKLGLGVWVERGGFFFGMLGGVGDLYLRMRAGT
jgi:hypothetical protein